MNLLRKLRALFRKEKLDTEMAEEMRHHLDAQMRRNLAAGMSLDEAHHAARRSFGGVEQIKERARDQRGWVWVDQLRQDLRYTVRSLRKHPGFTLTVLLTLALGIGANTALFSVVHGVLLKPLAYREPDRLVTLLHDGRGPVAAADFLDWRAQSQSFATMAAAEQFGGGILAGGDRPEAISGLRFSEGMFELLGVKPLLGRAFQAADFKPGADRVLVLGHALWVRRFGADASIVGQPIALSGETYTIVGVMPPDFRFVPFWAAGAEMASPLDLTPRAMARDGNSLRVFGRLKPGVSLEQAQAEMNAICRQLELAFPKSNKGRTVKVDPLIDKVVGGLRGSLEVLSGAVGIVLLIACANVVNLLLARATSRQKEMAVRVALGASRGRTIRQLLTESAVLALGGGALGVWFGYLGIGAIKGLLATDVATGRIRMPRATEIAMDSTTLVFSLSVVAVTALAIGLLPAWQASRFAQQDALQDGGRGTTGGRRGQRIRSALTIAQIALAMITLVGAGLLLRSFARVAAIDPGFDSRGVLALVVSLHGQPSMVEGQRETFYQEALNKIAALPGVTSVSAVNHLPLAGDVWNFTVAPEGRPPPKPGETLSATFRVCRPEYFQTMGMSLLRGRDFSATDRPESPSVIIVNEQLARRHWPGEDPVGRRVTLDDPAGHPKWRTVIGVVKNVKQRNWTAEVDAEFYLPFTQSPFYYEAASHYSAMTLVVRTAVEPTTLAAAVQSAVRSVNRTVPITGVATLEQVVAGAIWQPRFNLILIGLFALVSLLLAAVGLYGVVAYSVAQRTRELGIRAALGASHRDVFRLVLRQGMALVGLGLAIGLAGALGLTRVAASLLYQISPSDPATLACVSAVLALVAAFACGLPARRATKIDPMIALRAE